MSEEFEKLVTNCTNLAFACMDGEKHTVDAFCETRDEILAKYNALHAIVDGMESKLRWIPVSERLPEVKQDYLYLCWIDNGISEPYWDVRTWWSAWKQFSSDSVTHWMDWELEAPEV